MGRDSSQGVGEVLVREEVGRILPRGRRFSPEVEESPHISQCPLCNLLEKTKCCDCKEHKKIITLESLLT